MSDTYKCAWCGRYFEKSASSKFLSGASMGISNLGKKYCSASCKSASEVPKQSIIASDNSTHTYMEEDNDLELKMEEARLEHAKKLEESRNQHELKLASINFTNNAIERINNVDFGGSNLSIETISKDIDLCLTIAATCLAESFPNISSTNERDKFNQSEKVANASLKKAELGLNKLKLSEPSDKALKFYSVYKEQLRDSKIKQIRRSYEVQIRETKPETWIWFACIFFFPAILFPAFKIYKAMIVLPKKRDAEITQL